MTGQVRKTLAPQDALGGGGADRDVDGAEGPPLPHGIPLHRNAAALPTLSRRVLLPQITGAQPLVLEVSQGRYFVFLKDHFSSPAWVSQKQITTTHHPPKFN